MVKVKKDLTGRKFERLTVIEQVEDYVYPKSGRHEARWLCECSCEEHKRIIALDSKLKNKTTKSCGCIQKELMSKRFKKYNKYDLSNEYGVGYLDDGTEFYFDLEDYDLIKDIKWKKDKDGYIISNVYNKDTKKSMGIKMHRLVMNCPNEMFVDHINAHSRNDNRKSNLRICTQQENAMHRKISKNNTSGVTGVYWHSCINKWTAFIYYKGKRIELGSYKDFETAKQKRLEAEKEYYKEYSYNTNKEII